MMIIEDRSVLKRLFVVSWLIYFVSYIGRLNYAASMLAIGTKEGYSPSELGLVVTALFISYGVGQLLSGILGDKYSPIKLIVFGLLICALCNLGMGLTQGIAWMLGIWFVNGFGLALIWPPMMKIFTRHMPQAYLKQCCFNIQTSVAIGTFITYIFCGIVVAKYAWQWVFYIASILLVVAAVGAYITYTRIENYAKNQEDKRQKGEVQKSNNQIGAQLGTLKMNDQKMYEADNGKVHLGMKFLIGSGFVTILGAVLVMGFLKDGIMTWVPQYLTDTFKLNEYFSIFLSAVLPIINLSGIYVGKFIYHKTHEDDLKTTIILYGISSVSLVGLMIFGEQSMAMALGMFACVTSCMLGVNTILVSVLPTYFEPYGKTSTIAGVTNSVTYLGSALCGYGLGVIVQNYGWQMTRLILVGVCIVAILLCIVAYSRWTKAWR